MICMFTWSKSDLFLSSYAMVCIGVEKVFSGAKTLTGTSPATTIDL